MAIEIKELNMQLHIGGSSQTEQKDAAETVTNCDDCNDASDKEAMVRDTVKEVLRILKEQEER